MKQLPHLSFSSLELWQACPTAFWAKYLCGEELPAGDAAAFGKRFEDNLTHSLGLGEKPKPTGDETTDTEIEAAIKLYGRWPLGWKRADVAQNRIEITPEQWANYADLYGVASEIPVKLIGFTDFERRMDDGVRLEILDTKTSKFSGFRPSWALQLTLYGMAQRAYQIGVHVLVRTKQPKLESYFWTLNKQNIAWMMTNLGDTAAQIGAALERDDPGSLPRRPGVNAMDKHCEWCPRQLDCQARILAGTICQS